MNSADVDLRVHLGRLKLANPVMVASGTFGYAREMAGLVDLDRLGGILPKTITREPRAGNAPWRRSRPPAACSTRSAWITTVLMHSSRTICLTATLRMAIVVSIAGRTHDEFVAMCRQ